MRSTLALASMLVLALATGCARDPVLVSTPGPRGDVVLDDERGPRKLGRIPPGHYPPPGQCRVWFPGRPPGQQPPPRRCRELRGRVPRGAFVLYNGNAWDTTYDWHHYENRRPGSVPRIILELVAMTRGR